MSLIKTLPTQRLPIKTSLHSSAERRMTDEAVRTDLKKGHQAYVVTPLIEDSEAFEATSVEAAFDRYKIAFSGYRTAMLHGKMKDDEKSQIMNSFKAGNIDILVSTTVIEVGVDVPNASIIIIESAERFGLAQLHQLRGRVGRGPEQSYCYLVMADSKAPSARLREIERSEDGFYLAEVDLRLRGPGEIYGRLQHGALNLRIASLSDTKLIARAQTQVAQFIKSGEDIHSYEVLAQHVEHYQRVTTLN
jgi:ATP-dependent DNA helicase RecG